MPRSDLTRPLLALGEGPRGGASISGIRLPFGILSIGFGLLVTVLSYGCGKPAESAEALGPAESAETAQWVGAPGDVAPTWSHAFASPNALGRAVLHAIEADDGLEFAASRVTRNEYETLLWDELSVRNGGAPLDFVWQMNNDNSRMGLKALLEEFGGQEFEFEGVRFSEPPEHYADFTLYFGAQLWVRRVSDGKEGVLPALSVLVERRGLWKLLNIPE